MVSDEDLKIFGSCIDLDIVKLYPHLSYIRPRRPAHVWANIVFPRVKLPVAAVAVAAPGEPVMAEIVPAEAVPDEPVAEAVQAEPVVEVLPAEPAQEASRAQPIRQQRHRQLVRPSWLPANWEFFQSTRKAGISKGNKDMHYIDPYGKECRSKPEVFKRLEALRQYQERVKAKGKCRFY